MHLSSSSGRSRRLTAAAAAISVGGGCGGAEPASPETQDPGSEPTATEPKSEQEASGVDEVDVAAATTMCDFLESRLTSLAEDSDHSGILARGALYRRAIEPLEALGPTEGIGSGVERLMANMYEAAAAWDTFDTAFVAALEEAGLNDPKTEFGIAGDGTVYRLPAGSPYGVMDSGLDPGLYLTAIEADEAVNAAADALGLSGSVFLPSDEG